MYIRQFGLVATFCLAALVTSAASKETVLDRYVKTPDSNYKWEQVGTIEGKGFKGYVLNMTSQQWRTEKEVDRILWKHWVTIYRPDTLKSNTAFLYITGGNNNSQPPSRAEALTSQIAMDTGAIAVELRMVPNQPLTFPDDGKPRTEDGIIAYTWDKYMRGGDDHWPLRLPMTKAAVRAMDTVTAFLATDKGGTPVNVDKFVVSGGSKRGWTAWTTAAVDKRVVAVVPLVIDMLNVVPSFEHHWRAYGFWAPAVGDYQTKGIMDRTGTKEYRALMKIEEPYEYRDRLTMPKYIINAAGDQSFLPDSSQYYWKDLKGEKYLRYVPNADHSLGGSDAPQGLIAWLDSFLKGNKRPEYTWKVEKNGDIEVHSKDKPSEVKVWTAVNPDARDFRVEKIGRVYKSAALTETKPGVWIAKAPKVEKGYAAYFVELQYPSGTKYPFKFTTQVKVWPDTYTHPKFVAKKVD